MWYDLWNAQYENHMLTYYAYVYACIYIYTQLFTYLHCIYIGYTGASQKFVSSSINNFGVSLSYGSTANCGTTWHSYKFRWGEWILKCEARNLPKIFWEFQASLLCLQPLSNHPRRPPFFSQCYTATRLGSDWNIRQAQAGCGRRILWACGHVPKMSVPNSMDFTEFPEIWKMNKNE